MPIDRYSSAGEGATGTGRHVSTASSAPGDAAPTSSSPGQRNAKAAASLADDAAITTDVPVVATNEVDAIPQGSRFSAGTASAPAGDRSATDVCAGPTIAKLMWSGLLAGVGVAAFVDETVFHQLLHWHHFYDKSSAAVGLVSDGLFHAFGWVAIVAGLVLLADLRRRGAFAARPWWGALLLGLGGFQLYDGVIQHKLLRLHQIRYQVNLLPYDTTWIALAVLFLLVGVVLVLRSPRRAVDRA
jgi:uncharacterized membrane protein